MIHLKLSHARTREAAELVETPEARELLARVLEPENVVEVPGAMPGAAQVKYLATIAEARALVAAFEEAAPKSPCSNKLLAVGQKIVRAINHATRKDQSNV